MAADMKDVVPRIDLCTDVLQGGLQLDGVYANKRLASETTERQSVFLTYTGLPLIEG